jgi:hypothetical protein
MLVKIASEGVKGSNLLLALIDIPKSDGDTLYFGKEAAGKKVRKSIDQTVPVLMRNSLSPFHRKSHCRELRNSGPS